MAKEKIEKPAASPEGQAGGPANNVSQSETLGGETKTKTPPQAAAPPPQQSAQPQQSGMSSGTKWGLGIGGCCCCLLVIIILFILLSMRGCLSPMMFKF